MYKLAGGAGWKARNMVAEDIFVTPVKLFSSFFAFVASVTSRSFNNADRTQKKDTCFNRTFLYYAMVSLFCVYF